MDLLAQPQKPSLFRGDKTIFIVIIFLLICSIYGVYSNTGGGLFVTILASCLGLVSMVVVANISYQWISRFANLGIIVAFVLLVVTVFFSTLFPEKVSAQWTGRAIMIGDFTFQTFYLIGFLVIFYVCKKIAVKLAQEEDMTQNDNLKIVGVVLLFCGGMAYRNVSTALILFLTCLVILFIGRIQRKYILLLVVLGLLGGAGYMFTKVGRTSTFTHRVEYYFTGDNANHYGDQTILAKASIARSGVLPQGPGNGLIKSHLGESDTDYIYASIFEEVGLLVGFLILGCYIMLFYRSWRIARRSDGPFGMLLALGIGFWIASQALIHIGVNCELLPATGQTLPFISNGNASSIVSGFAMGIVLNIGKRAKIQEEIVEI